MKTIYRIEDKEGYGMYRSGRNLEYFFTSDRERHPQPHNDSLLCQEFSIYSNLYFNSDGVPTEESEYYFGFGSIQQLRNWIYKDDWLVELHNIGFMISEYTCEDNNAHVGYTQAVFINEVEYKQYSILEYFNLKQSFPYANMMG